MTEPAVAQQNLEDVEDFTERLSTTFDTCYTWSYDTFRVGLKNLYDKAKQNQWDQATALDWSIDVDPEAENVPDMNNPLYGTRLWSKFTEREIRKFRLEQLSWSLSQFLHGEQGALLATAQIVDAVPWIEAKYYAATQVMDEARHVETYDHYLRDKIKKEYPINPHLKTLLDQILTDSRWDMKYLGMQILVEGLAMAAFGLMEKFSNEPLLKTMTQYIMRDESRHVAFGVLSLEEVYRDMTEGERREREEFVIEAAMLMRDRLLMDEVWERLGFDVKQWTAWSLATPFMGGFRQLLFSKIVPNLKRLGLLTPRVRSTFEKIGVLEFEHMPDSTQDESVSLPPQVIAFLGRVASQIGTPAAQAS